MTQDQIKNIIRSLLISAGAFAAGRGWITTADASWLSTPDALQFIGAILAGGAAIWGIISHKQVNMVAAVAAMPEVKTVVTTATPAGVDLATAANSSAGPSGTVVASKS